MTAFQHSFATRKAISGSGLGFERNSNGIRTEDLIKSWPGFPKGDANHCTTFNTGGIATWSSPGIALNQEFPSSSTIITEFSNMPALPNFLNPKSSSEPHTVPPIPITTYYLTTSPPSPTSLRPISPPRPGPQAIPPSSLLFSLTHPSPSTSDTTLFFLTCLPDPIGFLHHSAHFIRPHLSRSSTQNPSSRQAQAEAWRHQMMELILEDEPGLAATSGGRIHVSLQWVGGVMREVQGGKRDMQSAVKEFKGVRELSPFLPSTLLSLSLGPGFVHRLAFSITCLYWLSSDGR